jgi:hypothetical protein
VLEQALLDLVTHVRDFLLEYQAYAAAYDSPTVSAMHDGVCEVAPANDVGKVANVIEVLDVDGATARVHGFWRVSLCGAQPASFETSVL